MFRSARGGAHALIALAVVMAPMLAPEHVHEADEHHDDAVVHRHRAAHEHDPTTVSDDDGAVVWLSTPGTLVSGAPLASPVVLASAFRLAPPCLESQPRHRDTPEASHDPPRSLSPSRAPPASA